MSGLTIADIARRAGVSKATVSRVLNDRREGVGEETRERVRAVLIETGFRPATAARCLSTGESRAIGIIIPDIANPFYPQLVGGAEEALAEAGYHLFLCNARGDVDREAAYVDALIDRRVDGVMIDSAGSALDGHLDRLTEAGVPVVLLDRVVGGRTTRPGVFVDNEAGARDAIRYLLAGGNRRLLFINGPAHLSQSVERLAGARRAIAEAGIDPENVRLLNGDFTLEGGCRLVEELLAGGRRDFDAIFAANDLTALGALRALRRAGVAVPEEVEVIGFDDIETSRIVDPPLTTVSQPTREMGAEGAALMLRLIAGRRPRRETVVLNARLEPRGTTRPREIPSEVRQKSSTRISHGKL